MGAITSMETLKIVGSIHWKGWHEDGSLFVEGENHNIITNWGDQYIVAMLANSAPTLSGTAAGSAGGFTKISNPASGYSSSANGFMILGSGWTGVGTKPVYWPNTAIAGQNTYALSAIDPYFPVMVNQTTTQYAYSTNNPALSGYSGLTALTTSTSGVVGTSSPPSTNFNTLTFQKTWTNPSFASGTITVNEVALTNQFASVSSPYTAPSSSANLITLAYAQINPAVTFTNTDTYQIVWNITFLGN